MPPQAWIERAGGGEDEANDVYGVALRAENRRIGRGIEPLRKAAFLYGMACIALEDTLAGGGTYSIHVPHEMFASSERMIRALLARRSGPRETARGAGEVERTLRRCLALKTAPERALGGRVDSPSLHRFAALALRYERELRDLASAYPRPKRASVDRFVVDWGRDYLGTRGADAVLSR